MITCFIRTLNGIYKAESEWDHLDALIKSQDIDLFTLHGKVKLSGLGATDVEIDDLLEPLIQHLLLNAVFSLLDDQDFIYKIWDYEGSIHMNQSNGNIEIAGDYIPTVSVPKKELIGDLLNGVEKMLNLMKLIKSKHDEFEFDAYPIFKTSYDEAMLRYQKYFS